MYEQDVFEADTFDAIGTGDAFVGGFIAERLRGGDLPCSPAVGGSATAALKRTTDGDLAVTTRAEVRSVIDGESGSIVELASNSGRLVRPLCSHPNAMPVS